MSTSDLSTKPVAGITNNAAVNWTAAGGLGAMSGACVGVAALNAGAGFPVAGLYYTGLATMFGAASYTMVNDVW